MEIIEQLEKWIAQGYFVQLRGQKLVDGAHGWTVKIETLDTDGEMTKKPDRLALSVRTPICMTIPDAIEAARKIVG